MKKIGEFISVKTLKSDRIFEGKEIIVRVGSIGMVSVFDRGELVITLNDGSAITCG